LKTAVALAAMLRPFLLRPGTQRNVHNFS